MNLDFLPLLRKRLEETAEQRVAQMTAAAERLAIEGLRDAGGSMSCAEFAASWEVLGDAMLKHLETRGLAQSAEGRVHLTEAGRGALQA